MQISFAHAEAFAHDTPLLVLGTWEGETPPKTIADLVEEGDWTGQFKQTLLLYPRGAVSARRVLLLGLGSRSRISFDRLCDAAAQAARRVRALRIDHYSFQVPNTEGLSFNNAAQALAEGSLLGLYRFDEYRTKLSEAERHTISSLTLIATGGDDAINEGLKRGQAIAAGVARARDLENHPGNVVTPTRLAETAREVGERAGATVTILDREQLQAQGFGGILAVGQGSAQEPRFIVLEYGRKRDDAPTICLVGKGITFDSGGISIKPAERMAEMKTDMSGAAAVIGAIQVASDLKLPLHVIGLIASAENMPSGTAIKPGDVITTLSGTTVEVLNTDAEGRIVLADALFYAQRFQPDAIIDLATLTGAVSIALGAHASGLVSNDDALADRILRAGDATGERAWRLPLWEPYKDMVRSEVADIRNTGGSRYGGAITAAAFLSHFVGDIPWAHLDIAGTAYNEIMPKKAYLLRGATGVGVRLLTNLLYTWSEAHS